MCEFEEIVVGIKEKYNLLEAESVTHLVDNLANEVAEYKPYRHRAMALERTINDIRAILKLKRGESIIEAVMELKREPRYEERILDPVRMMQWLVNHGWKVRSDGGWMAPGDEPNFNPKMFALCGGTDRDDWVWHPEWIEKVEIK